MIYYKGCRQALRKQDARLLFDTFESSAGYILLRMCDRNPSGFYRMLELMMITDTSNLIPSIRFQRLDNLSG